MTVANLGEPPLRAGGRADEQGAQARPKVRLAVLASGAGTILEAILSSGLDVCVVVVDRPCRAQEVASSARIPTELLLRESFASNFDRRAYTLRLVAALEDHRADVIAMAGFGTVLSGEIFTSFPGRVLNTHPALLPNFKGWHAVRDALAAGVSVTGTTVHIATEEVDDGPILAQQEVPVLPGDTEGSLHLRIKAVERRLYPQTIRRFMAQLQREKEGLG